MFATQSSMSKAKGRRVTKGSSSRKRVRPGPWDRDRGTAPSMYEQPRERRRLEGES